MWTTARYLPTTLFSLRPAMATSSGAQTLLVPTPFSIKMALVTAALRLWGLEEGIKYWPAIRDMEVALRGPDTLVVNKTFIKIQRFTRFAKNKPEEFAQVMEEQRYPFNPTIAYREFVYYGDVVDLAFRSQQELPFDTLLPQLTYFGKRGSFWQLQALPTTSETLPDDWTLLTTTQSSFSVTGTLQMLDDCGSNLTWDHIDVYSSKSIKLGDDERVLRPVVLPYHLERSSYRYNLYRREEH